MEIKTHIVEGDTAPQVKIEVLDDPGQGGAHHSYLISWCQEREVGVAKGGAPERRLTLVQFQNGPIREFGINGLTNEALLAIVMHRLECFQAGPFANEDNNAALAYAQLMMEHLQERTRDRIRRGVEGTNRQ